jgi:Domain of unknown function (DUF4192)
MTTEAFPEPGLPGAEFTFTVDRGESQVIGVTSASEVVGLVPYLLGFHPEESLVVLVLTGPQGSPLKFTLRLPLGKPDDPDTGVWPVAAVVAARGCRRAVVVAYGTEARAAPAVEQFRAAAAERGMELQDVLRVEGGRFWSYVCADPSCCPPEGTPWTLADDPEPALLLPKGMPGVLDRREDLEAEVASVTGADAETMRHATRQAEARAARLRQQAEDGGQPAHTLLVREGIEAMVAVLRTYRDGGDVPRGELAWLTVVLRDNHVRDDAWSQLGEPPADDELRLMTDLTRLARPGYVAAPAALLAYAAWQAGNGALANVAAARALADNPGYGLAEMVTQAVAGGVDASDVRMPMTPEMIAEEYARSRDGCLRLFFVRLTWSSGDEVAEPLIAREQSFFLKAPEAAGTGLS